MMQYPIGIQSFETIRTDGYVYVDKTDLIYKLAQGHVYFLARPRRFGKSLLVSIISCYTVYTEKQLSEGRADCIVETPLYIYIFEFKLDGTAREALRQINDRGYAKPYEADSRPIYKIGATFSSKTGTIEEWETLKI